MDVLAAFMVPALVGVGVGVLSGLLGIGGGTVLVPIFRLAFGMAPVGATATSLFTIVPTSVSGVVEHVRHRTCIPALGVAAGLGGALASPLGVWLASVSPGWLIMLAAALIIGYSAVNMLRKAIKATPAASATSTAPAVSTALGAQPTPSASEIPSAAASSTAPALSTRAVGSASRSTLGAPSPSFAMPKMTRKQLAIGAAIGLFAGLASGYVGVGGGFIMVPLMLSLVGITMKQASGTSLVAVAILAVPGVISQALLGNIHYLAGIAVAVGSIPGAIVGARLVQVVPERQLRFLFGGFLFAAAAMLIVNEFGILG